ncbi:MAG: hypothetical protein HYZ52_01565 [Candidatus Omnitrophica bacterium]|nr:hypothetical protein [Candidatus Omnitrophota bacterium]
MKLQKALLGIFLFLLTALGSAGATERLFTYTYEPETMPQGAWEFENHVTSRLGRNKTVGQDHYNRWDFRQEIEYGVNDNYLLSFYLNEKVENFHSVSENAHRSESEFEGVSIENKFLVLDPATHPVGLALYLEPRFAAHETELEEKIILGKRNGDWKWALNLTHATEWKDEGETEGELEVTFGAAKQLNKRWALGFEFRDHNEIEDYSEWKHSAYFLGPVVNYRRESWWVTVTALAQAYGKNYGSDPDGAKSLVLDEHERLNIRCIVGIEF